MKKELEIGTLMSGQKFNLPLDLVTRTLAIVAIRGWGKTIAATVIAEEFCETGMPWVAIDPVGVWWGLRCNPDGSPGGYPVVIIGGQHGDLPLEKDKGAQVADAILQENLCCVIDMKLESKTAVRHFVADFCDRLMELQPRVPRHIFLEEAPELVPQKPMGEQKRSLAAVDRLIRLGRNQGYGATLISQRYATIQKDVLTQCESLIAGRMIGKTDRVASEEWIGEVASSLFSTRKADKFVEGLAGLDSGHGWFLSPQWDNRFVEVQIRRRKTYHPGETRTVGMAPKQVQLSDVREFVERFGKMLKAKPIIEHSRPAVQREAVHRSLDQPDQRDMQIDSLRTENQSLRNQLRQATAALAGVRTQLEPQYRAMQTLFGDLEKAVASGNGHPNAAAFEQWKEKLGAGPAKLINILLERGELTRVQLKTLAGYSRRSMDNFISTLNANQLIVKNGGNVALRTE